MRDGRRVYDSDTHIQPSAETLERYFDQDLKDRIPDRQQHLAPIRMGLAGEVRDEPFRHSFRLPTTLRRAEDPPRILGEAAPRPGAKRQFQKFWGSKFPTDGGQDDSPQVRLADMDEEGMDVHMMVPPGANGHEDPAVEMGFIRATHRYLDEFCSASPRRLKSLIVVSSRCVPESVQEIRRWSKSSWAVGIQPYFPAGYPLDHPDMEPIWAAAQAADLTICHHSFVAGEWPGYRDLWENPFLGRTASHPWSAMRSLAAFVCSGIMDRYPNIRYAILESGFGWLPFWGKRMDDQVVYMGTVAEGLKYKPSEYLASGRFFSSIIQHEGPDICQMVSRMLADSFLMFSSDYPHAESHFPHSADQFLQWKTLGDAMTDRMLWDNPVRCFGEP